MITTTAINTRSLLAGLTSREQPRRDSLHDRAAEQATCTSYNSIAFADLIIISAQVACHHRLVPSQQILQPVPTAVNLCQLVPMDDSCCYYMSMCCCEKEMDDRAKRSMHMGGEAVLCPADLP